METILEFETSTSKLGSCETQRDRGALGSVPVGVGPDAVWPGKYATIGGP